ncbi:cytochrome D1 domain-containing protein [Niveibacterium microcysteis]|uniref:C-type cytochrome n=1 Tax=Niveibacterium microcysteis TaxID=2811415 RepID=A0ABX7M5E1_9RHOO|nr:cytochrome D1 domain-containing protein [Niveibacterium microcysteis]QSI76398.1 c-type cytochrome [Niveibacterium microcysteis]
MRRLLAAALLSAAALAQAADPAALFQQHCASCHGADRLGIMGPALLPESLERLKKPEAIKTIRDGRAATQMQGFADRLAPADIEALAGWLYTPVEPAPHWTEADTAASRVVHFAPGSLPDTPQFKADPLNLFVVVEAGNSTVSILDGDRFERLDRFPSKFALHGGPKFTPDGRYVFFASRDGWVSKYDLYNLKTVAEIRVGLNTRNVAVSADGHFVAAANTLPRTIVLMDADLKPIKTIAVANLKGDQPSRVAAIYDAGPRKSFVAALRDIPELWEISYDPKAEPIHDGYVHDFKMGEAIAKPGYLNVRRVPLEESMEDFFFDPPYRNAIGAARSGGRAQVVNLDARIKVAELPVAGMPHVGSGITWAYEGTTVLATPNLRESVISVIDLKSWREIAQIPALGPGFFLRSHSSTPYAWADAMMSPKKDTMLLIDKATLKPAGTITPAPGKTAAHVEFDRSGRHAVVSIWERETDGGALVIIDAKTLKEVKRLPADKPVGKYNVWNKTQKDEGTSH